MPPIAPECVASRYRVLHAIGEGGMGQVYLALDETLKRQVALKAIRAEQRLNPDAKARFVREARVLSQLDHPRICRVFDYLETPENDWIVLELIEGQSLRDAMRRHLPMAQRLALARQIADVLVVTHAAGVVHRDLKPGNVMVTASGDIKVLDFGLARGLEPLEFRFDRSSRLQLSKPTGAYVRAERTKDGVLVARFTVRPFRMERRAGALASYLPLIAVDLQRADARRYENFRLQFEGRARVNEVEGYQYAFTTRLRQEGRPPRQLFGRVVVLPEPYSYEDPETEYPPGRNPTRGVLLTMLATTLDEAPSATRVGDEGILQRPFRSFRYGKD